MLSPASTITVASRCTVPQVRVRPLDANLGPSANLESTVRRHRVLLGKQIPSALSAAFLRALCVLRFLPPTPPKSQPSLSLQKSTELPPCVPRIPPYGEVCLISSF